MILDSIGSIQIIQQIIYSNIILMYIDSPNFVRRKVLNSSNTPSPIKHDTNPSSPPQYQYGLERSLLAQHVSQRLNQHDKDYEILKRFREEAQQLKRNKWLKRIRPARQDIQRDSLKSKSTNFIKYQNRESYNQSKPLLPIVEQPTYHPATMIVDQYRKVSQKSQEVGHRFEKILRSRDKQLKKKQHKLKRSKQVIQKMQDKIKELEEQNKIMHKREELEMQKISSLIQEMNYKIAFNRAIFQEELVKLKAQKMDNKATYPLKTIQTEQISYTSAPLNKRKKPYTRFQGSQREIISPSIFYQLPQIAKQRSKSISKVQLPYSSMSKYNPEQY